MTALLSSLSIGSIVKLDVNEIPTEFLVVHQGNPNNDLYDESCNGTWLLMKDVYENKQWHSSKVNNYANSTIHNYLNNNFLNLFNEDVKNGIKQVKIPYCPEGGTNPIVSSGSDGLSCKIFLLSDREVGFTKTNLNSRIVDDGEKLSYFQNSINTKEKIAYFESSSAIWWLRSPEGQTSETSWAVSLNGGGTCSYCSSSWGIRPAFILPSSTLISDIPDSDNCYSVYFSPWSAKWTFNTTHHWHECLLEECLDIVENSEKEGYSEHISSDWIIIKEPEFQEIGLRHKVCTVCGYELETEEIPALLYRKIKELQQGDKIKFGKYQVKDEEPEPIVWQIAGKHLYNNNEVTFISEKILDLRAFDAADQTSNDDYEKTYGSNRYDRSNIEQWLNSNEENWHTNFTGTPPTNDYVINNTGYKDKKGFLYHFQQKEIDCILPSLKRKVAKYMKYGELGNGFEYFYDKVFLPSVTELGLSSVYINNISDFVEENSAFYYDILKKCYLTEQCFNNTDSTIKPEDINTPWKYWVRSPSGAVSYQNSYIDSTGSRSTTYCYDGSYGIRPALSLNENLFINPDEDGYYTIVNPPEWNQEWEYNSTHHWHECLSGLCLETTENSEKKDYNTHSISNNWIIVKEPTYQEPGLKQKRCSVCGYVSEEEEIPQKVFKTINDLTEGDKIEFGRYKLNDGAVQSLYWEIATKTNNSATFITRNIIDLKAFDAKETTNPDTTIQQNGNNDYSISNIRQWLNSNADAGNWYSAQHSYDKPPDTSSSVGSNGNPYSAKPGFLNNFTSQELNAIIPSVNEDKIFLPSSIEMGLEEGDNKFYDSITNNLKTSLGTYTFSNVLGGTKPSSATAFWRYSLRNSDPSTAYKIKAVSDTGTLNSTYAACAGFLGIRPCLTLQQTVFFVKDNEEEEYFTLKYHDHIIDEEWSYNSTHHWHECLDPNCPIVDNEQKPNYGAHVKEEEWEIIKEPTYEERGQQVKKCTVCGYIMESETIPSLSEQYTEIILSDSIKTRKPTKGIYLNAEIITENTNYEFTVKACNNGFDANPTWEDITQNVLKKKKCVLTNETKTSENWGVKIKIILSKEINTSPVIINGLVFSY